MKINYKIITIILAGILLITYSWHWRDIFFHDSYTEKHNTSTNMQSNKMSGMHMMPNGQMMSNDGMNMDNMNMGNGMMDMTMSDMVKMMDGKTGKALEKEFIIGMIPHHQGAVDMAKKLLEDKTISGEIRKFGEDIIKAQESEIKMMNEWLKKY